MLSRRLPAILPTLNFEEATLKTTMVYSVAGMLGQRVLIRVPHGLRAKLTYDPTLTAVVLRELLPRRWPHLALTRARPLCQRE